jgi:hypothetical protein
MVKTQMKNAGSREGVKSGGGWDVVPTRLSPGRRGDIRPVVFFENKAGSPVGWDWTAASRPAPRGDGWGYFVA